VIIGLHMHRKLNACEYWFKHTRKLNACDYWFTLT